jgi:general secretion pathway protein A
MQLEYYGFSDRPFELSPDLKFLFLTAGYRIALEALGRGILDRKGLVVLIGEVGTGKTMMIYSVMERLPPKVKTAFIFHSTFNFKELLQQIFSELDEVVPVGGMDELKDQFLLYLGQLKDQGETLAVFLDEAQKLSEEVVGGLFSLLKAESWVSEIFQVVLVGQPELEETFQAAFLRHRPNINPLQIKINPLSRQESLDYIEHRLKMVGRSSLEIFSPQALSLVVEKAEGIPRLINILCDNALFAGFKASIKRIEVNLIEGVIHNLEGPEYKPKKEKMPPLQITSTRLSYRLFIRDGLIVIFGFALVFGTFLVRPELTGQLTNLKLLQYINPVLTKAGDLIKKNPPKKNNQEKPEKINLIPDGHSNSEQKKALEGPDQSPSLSLPLMRKIQVKEGDYLSKIVFKHYGKLNESLIDLVLMHNSSISNIDLVLIDQQIELPELSEKTLIIPSKDTSFHIHLGTFPNTKEADQFKSLPVLKGKNVAVRPQKVSPHQTWYRVEAGSYPSKNETLEVIKTLRGKGLLPFF